MQNRVRQALDVCLGQDSRIYTIVYQQTQMLKMTTMNLFVQRIPFHPSIPDNEPLETYSSDLTNSFIIRRTNTNLEIKIEEK